MYSPPHLRNWLASAPARRWRSSEPARLAYSRRIARSGRERLRSTSSTAFRNAKTKELGATPVDFSKGDPVEQIFDLRKKNKGIQQGLRPGEEKMKGVDCAIDAVGYQARSDDSPDNENPTQVLENCVRAVNATVGIGMIGVSIAPDPGAKSEHAKKGIFPFAVAEFFDKGITMGSGRAPCQEIQRIFV